MSLKAFLEARKLSDSSADKLLKDMEALQGRMAQALSDELTNLQVVGGKLLNTEANIAALGRVSAIIEAAVLDPLWIEAVSDYIESMDGVTDDLVKYLGTLGEVDEVPLRALNRQFKQIVASTLTNPQTYASAVTLPAVQDLGASISAQASLSDAIASIEITVTGGEDSLGPIAGDIGPTAVDMGKIAERSITQTAADQLGVQFYLYQGSEIDTTRPFCEERRGKVWHKTEIEGWASLEWAGKVKGTNEDTIFLYLGGWYGKERGCRHALTPLARRDVPASDLARMKSKGLIE